VAGSGLTARRRTGLCFYIAFRTRRRRAALMDNECYPRNASACRLRGDTGDKCCSTYVVVLCEGVLSAYDCITVNKATKPTITDSSLRRQESWGE
jgi:hypothetical protein